MITPINFENSIIILFAVTMFYVAMSSRMEAYVKMLAAQGAKLEEEGALVAGVQRLIGQGGGAHPIGGLQLVGDGLGAVVRGQGFGHCHARRLGGRGAPRE